MSSMFADLALALNPTLTAEQAGITPDPWQAELIASDSPQGIVLVARQHGKSEGAILKALSIMRTEADSTVLVISPSQRISDTMVRRAKAAYRRIKGAPALIGDNLRSMELESGSRLLALPGDNDGDTIRGLSNIRLAIVDEASRVSDELVGAVSPMLATHPRAQLLMLSTPAGKRGIFYETWHNGDPDWHRIHVPLGCPRITPEFLARERKRLGDTIYRQEYECEFLDNDTAAFNTDLIDAAFTNEVRPLWT